MKHTSRVKDYDGSNKELANQVGDLFYDSMSEFLVYLAQKIRTDGEKDHARGRVKLATELFACSDNILTASKNVSTAWKICEPYVEEWLTNNGVERS